jgi:hypothetical protein
MRCSQCGREQNPGEQGWVVVLPAKRDEARSVYCPTCMTEIVRAAAGKSS